MGEVLENRGAVKGFQETCVSTTTFYVVQHITVTVGRIANLHWGTRRRYYERTNSLVQQYIYIDRLLDSSLPHDLLNEYQTKGNGSGGVMVPDTISEEPTTPGSGTISPANSSKNLNGATTTAKKVKRTPRDIYKV